MPNFEKINLPVVRIIFNEMLDTRSLLGGRASSIILKIEIKASSIITKIILPLKTTIKTSNISFLLHK